MTVAFALSETGSVVDDLVALNAGVWPVMSRRDHVAWVMNVLAHVVGPQLVECDGRGYSLIAADARAIHLRADVSEEGYLTMGLGAFALPEGGATPPAAAFALARIFAPAVNALAFAGPLAPRALWRIAGDGLAWGWVNSGATERGRAILTAYGAPFANRQLTFGEGTMARRGGCCRYLSVSGQACANCPLTAKRRPGTT